MALTREERTLLASVTLTLGEISHIRAAIEVVILYGVDFSSKEILEGISQTLLIEAQNVLREVRS